MPEKRDLHTKNTEDLQSMPLKAELNANQFLYMRTLPKDWKKQCLVLTQD
jgi:hypothetical protein